MRQHLLDEIDAAGHLVPSNTKTVSDPTPICKDAPMVKEILLVLLSALSVSGAGADMKPIIAKDAKLEKLADGFMFTEGPASDRKGNVFFTDQPNDRIMEWSVDGKLSTFMQPCGRANGLCFDAVGNLWACADEKNELWRIAPDKTVAVVLANYDGKLMN